MIKFLLLGLFVYVPAFCFYLLFGVVLFAYLKKNGYLKRFIKNKHEGNKASDYQEDDAYEEEN